MRNKLVRRIWNMTGALLVLAIFVGLAVVWWKDPVIDDAQLWPLTYLAPSYKRFAGHAWLIFPIVWLSVAIIIEIRQRKKE